VTDALQPVPNVGPMEGLRRPRRFADMSHRSFVVRMLMHLAGILLLILGIAGFFLPILQGVLFTFLALIILAAANGWVRRRLDSWLDGHPRVDRLFWKSSLLLRRVRGRGRAKDRPREREEAAQRRREAAVR
jgi:hypothetical protein